MFKNLKFNPGLVFIMLYIHIGAISAFFFPFKIEYFYVGLFNYLWFGYASSLYYHRYLTHRGFEMVKPLQIFYLLGGLIGLGGSPVDWVAIHRYHHQNSDTDKDVHSPKDGWRYSYCGWYLKADYSFYKKINYLAEDIRANWYIRASEGFIASVVLHISYLALTYYYLGLAGTLYALFMPVMLSYHFLFLLIAHFCHLPMLGSKRAETYDNSRNIWWLAPLSFGEAYHNNHHEYPKRAVHGLAPTDFDLTKWTLIIFEKLKLVNKVRWEK